MTTSKRKLLLITIVAALCLLTASMVLVACDNTKPTFTVTLDAGAGNLNNTSYVAEKDSKILDIVADIAPSADGMFFDGWLLNGEPLAEADTLTDNVTLTAQYKVAYKVEVYYQNADKSNYVQDTTKTVNAYGKVGESVSPNVADMEGYVLNRELSADATKVLAAGENLLRYYYARAEFKITYGNLTDEDMESVDFDTYFGAAETIADCMFTRDGYMFLGWSDNLAKGADAAFAAGETLDIEGNVTLYAQWGKVYEEAFGKSDTVGIAELESEGGTLLAGLSTESGLAIGTFDSRTKFFTVGDVKGQIDDEREVFLYDVSGLYLGYSLLGLATSEAYGTLSLNAVTGDAVYTLEDVVINGKYEECITENGVYTGEKYFTSDTEDFYFCFLDPDEDSELDTETYAGEFFRQGKEAGEYVVVDVSQGEFDVPYIYSIVLDGYGELEFKIVLDSGLSLVNTWGTYYGYNEETGEWTYEYEDQLFEDTVDYPEYFNFKVGYLKSAAGVEGSDFADGETLNQIPVLFIQDENALATYENEDGSVLDIDGYGFATYTPAGENAEPVEGYAKYLGTITKDTFEDIRIMMFTYDDITNGDLVQVKYLCDTSTGQFSQVADEAGSYRRYHFKENAVDILLDGNGYAELSLYNTDYEAGTLFAYGSYEMTNETDGAFTIEWGSPSLAYLGVAAGSFNFRLIETEEGASFIIRDETLFGTFHIDALEVTLDGYDKITVEETDYNYVDLGDGILQLTGANGETFGTIIVDRAAREIVSCDIEALFGEYLTVVYDNALYIGPGKLVFDGFGHAKFYEMEMGELVGSGVYTYDSTTGIGRFTPIGSSQFFAEAFDFILTQMVDDEGILQNVYLKYDKEKALNLTNGNQTLTLDGYETAVYNDGTTAITSKFDIAYTQDEYGDKDGTGVILFIETGYIFTFNTEDMSFEKVGNEYGLYFALVEGENGYILDAPVIELDGKGGVILYSVDMWGDVDEKTGTATYTKKNETEWTLTLEDGTSKTIKLQEVPTKDGGSKLAYAEFMESKQASYTCTQNGQTATLAVDGYGNATYTHFDGSIFTIDFWSVTIDNEEGLISITSDGFDWLPSRTICAVIDKTNNTFTSSYEFGTYSRFIDDNFYYPLLELDGEAFGNAGALYAFNRAGNPVVYAIGTYAPVLDEQNNPIPNEFIFTVTQKDPEAFEDIAHIVVGDTMRFRISNVDGEPVYIVYDEAKAGEFTFEETTFTLDGYGNVTTNNGQSGTADRVNDVLIVTIDGTTSYYKVGADNVLTQLVYMAFIEWII